MRLFFLERIFWQSVTYGVLRTLGVTRVRPYRVMVRAEPLRVTAIKSDKVELGGLFATRVVMAASHARAEVAAVAAVREAVLAFAHNPDEEPVCFHVEESANIEGIVWRQARGYSFYQGE